jgi:hypothetical protein
MRTNPNIILSGNQMAAPQLPDVNAMTQTRTAGMENVYKIERQRQEDALAMEDRAALQQEKTAAAEEKAMIEAVLPAYLFTIETGDAEGGFDLLPPQYQESFRPLVDQLAGKPPEQVRAAVYGSLVTSEAGRAALEAVQRAKNTEVQFGQLEVSRANAAREAAAANQPKVSFRETDAEGNVRMYDAAGNEIGMLPKAGKPAAAAGGAAATESERLAGYNAGRALDAAKRIATATKQSPEATAPGMGEAFTSLFVDPNFVRSEERQRVTAAQREMIDALLTLATGAAYNREQLEGQMESYIPRYTDEPGTREDKRAALLGLIQNAKIKAGRAWTPEMDASFEQLLTTPAGAAASGDVSGGAGGGAPGGIRDGATATNPQTGERIIYRDGQWQPL